METSYERTSSTKTYNVAHSNPPHSVVITRTGSSAQSQSGSGGGKVVRTVKTSSGGGGGGDFLFTEGQYSGMTATSVNAVKDARDQERKDMQDLNERFGNYIDKVHTDSQFSVVAFFLKILRKIPDHV